MSNLNSIPYTPAKINSVKFRIPLYQRPYAWESFQVEQLLKDLYHQFKVDQNQKYYIGILNVGNTENQNMFDLIDGQQRITTLCLIGSVLKSNYENWSIFLLNRLDLYGRKEDQTFLDRHENTAKTNQRLIEAVRVIKNFFAEIIAEEKDTFSRYVYDNAAFFISKVPDHYSLIDKNLQFVRMNNRGKQLEAHDILKIKLATIISDESIKNEFIKKWNEFSQLGCGKTSNEIKEDKKILELLNENEPNINIEKDTEIFYQSIVTYPEFLLIALSRFFKKQKSVIEVSQTKEKPDEEHSKHKLIEEFGFGEKKIDFEWTEINVLEFSEILCKQFDLFDKFIIKRDKEEKYKFNGDKERFFGNSLLELQVFQSFLYVTREPNQSNWLIETFDYLEVLKIINDKINTTDFLIQLKTIDNDRCKIRNSNSLEYGAVDRYWFWRLDYYLWENRKDIFTDKALEIADRYVFRLNRSIEHISPQTPESVNQIHVSQELRNSFGNLAMISSGQNSSLQNKSFQVKQAHVDSFIKGSTGGTIESLKMLDLYQKKTWNEDEIKLHSNRMIEVIINSFQHEEYSKIIENLKKNKFEISNDAK